MGILDRFFSYPLMFLVLIYKNIISPLFPNTCRFYPSCSTYAIIALKKHGLTKGVFLAAKRIIRCNPFNPGGVDPVPEKFNFFNK